MIHKLGCLQQLSGEICRLAALMLFTLLAPPGSASEVSVAASIRPVHALVAGVMVGVGSPALLLGSAGSPHDHSLKPSAARNLATADVVFWIGPGLESFLVKPLASSDGPRSVPLSQAPGVVLLPRRFVDADGHWSTRASSAPADHDHGEHAGADPHIWLDPRNAVAMVAHISAVLGEVYPALQSEFARNADAMTSRLIALDEATRAMLEPVEQQPYLVFHDAYQYFEHRYGLAVAGAVVTSPERRPGARRLREIRARIDTLGVRCVFSEPQFRSAIVATVIEGTDARSAVLDPLGAELEPGPESYFMLMGSLASSLRDCLQD